MSIASFYTTTFTLKRMTWATDGSGNEYSDLATVGTISGHIQQSSMELASSMGLAFTKTFTVWCAFGTNVAEGDQLLSGGFTYTVKAKQEFTNGSNAHIELICERESFDQ